MFTFVRSHINNYCLRDLLFGMSSAPLSPAPSVASTIDITGSTSSISTASQTRPFCVICQDDVAEDSIRTKCEHLFCRACIMDHMVDHVRCPQCRVALEAGNSRPASPNIDWVEVRYDGQPVDDFIDIGYEQPPPSPQQQPEPIYWPSPAPTIDIDDSPPASPQLRFDANSEPLADDEFEVEALLDFERRRIDGRRKAYYLVRWLGLGPAADTWIEAERIECPGLKALFRQRMACHPGGCNRQVRRRRPLWSETARLRELPGFDESGRFIPQGGHVNTSGD